MRMLRSSGDVATHWCGVQPVEVYGAGFSGALDCCRRARGSVSWQRTLRATPHPVVDAEGVVAVEVLSERVAGLDIGKASVTVCLRVPGPGRRRVGETRTFKTTTRALGVMRDWLTAAGVTHAAMESTSSYWKAPF
jgi:hypothetical protein